MYPVIDTWDPIDKYIELDEGQSTTFTCIYTASTNSSVTITTWKFYENFLSNSSHYTITTRYDDPLNINHVKSILRLSDVVNGNTGSYTCQCGYNPSVINVNSNINSNTVTFSLKVDAHSGGH